MFESLSDRLSGVFRDFRGQGRLTEENVQAGLREVRLALLEADVNFKVVKDFVENVREKCLGQEGLKGVSPAQQVVKIVHDALVALLGGETAGLQLQGREPAVIMLVGLQGSGKTTSAGKIANLLRKQKMRPYLVPADVYRPAAIDQLTVLARQLDMPCYPSTTDMNPVDIARQAVAAAREQQATVVLLDTAGRLHVDEPLMQELAAIKAAVEPQEILFVADAMTGQDAVTVAQSFNDRLGVTGVVLTKMDGDARGGAALSIRAVTGAPVKFVGMGEKLSEMEVFHPDRIAGRILGMGDVLTLVEKAQGAINAEEAGELARKMQKASFDLEDFRTQMRRIKKLGSLDSILKLIPGLGGLREKLAQAGGAVPEKELASIEYWIMGSLAGVTQSRVWFPVPMAISCCAVIFALHRQAMLLSVEEDEARLLGVSVGRMRFLLLTLATLVVAAVVSVTGLISFVGLLAPHCARLLAGHNRRSTSLLSGLVGSTLLLAADTIAKTVAATELPVSIFTSLLGVPFLLYLIIKPGRETR